MTRRERSGARRHLAHVRKHNGELDAHGNPDYADAGNWDTVIPDWPVELITTTGGETVRGKQVTAQTTHVFYGEYQGGSGVKADMRVEVDGIQYSVVSALDLDGDRREIRVEAKREE